MANELTLYNIIPSNKVISRVRERYYEGQKGPKSLDELCEYLNKTTKSNIFDVLIKELHKVRICCSILTAAADDAGETTIAVDENGNITGVEDVEIPDLRRYSMMFFPYIFEALSFVTLNLYIIKSQLLIFIISYAIFNKAENHIVYDT